MNDAMPEAELTGKRREILDFIAQQLRQRGYPPTVREIGEAVGLTSSSTVHAHLANLERLGPLQPDPSQPRALGAIRRGPPVLAASSAVGRRPTRPPFPSDPASVCCRCSAGSQRARRRSPSSTS